MSFPPLSFPPRVLPGSPAPSALDGWLRTRPAASLAFIHSFGLSKQAPILDVGASGLLEPLLAEGYENLTVLDQSAAVLAGAQRRLGPRSERVRWIEADLRAYVPDTPYAVWHDQLIFQGLTPGAELARYLHLARWAVRPAGYLLLGSCSATGPATCRERPVRAFNERVLAVQLADGFAKISCQPEAPHPTAYPRHRLFICAFRRNA